MKRAPLLIGALGLLAGTALAGDVDLDRSFHSTTLDREMAYGVYVPDSGTTAPLPVVYLLHGYGASHREWVEFGRVDALLDRLIAEGDIAPLIAVMPSAGKSWYVDSADRGGPGDVGTAIADELTAQVDATFATVADARGRAVMGLSMGGFGALVLGLDHPERFGQVAALSPAVFVPGGLSWERWSLGANEAELDAWFKGAFGAPFDFDVYRREQPAALIKQLDGAGPRIMLASGDSDYFGFELGTAELFLALRRAQLPVALRIGDGGHDWDYWRRATAEALLWLDAGWAER